jgi:hypothetical protein
MHEKTNLNSKALTQKSAKRYDAWFERMPQLERTEAKLLSLIEKCYSTFLSGTSSVQEIATEFNIPVDILATWSREGKWMKRREEFRQELLVNVEMDYANFVKRNRVKVAEEIVREVKPRLGQLSQAIGAALDSGDYKYVRSLSESLKHVSDLVTKTVGLDAPLPTSDRPNIQQVEGEAIKPAFFSINAKGPVQISSNESTKEKEQPVIDAEVVEREEKGEQ